MILIDADPGERWSGSTTPGTAIARVSISLSGMGIAYPTTPRPPVSLAARRSRPTIRPAISPADTIKISTETTVSIVGVRRDLPRYYVATIVSELDYFNQWDQKFTVHRVFLADAPRVFPVCVLLRYLRVLRKRPEILCRARSISLGFSNCPLKVRTFRSCSRFFSPPMKIRSRRWHLLAHVNVVDLSGRNELSPKLQQLH